MRILESIPTLIAWYLVSALLREVAASDDCYNELSDSIEVDYSTGTTYDDVSSSTEDYTDDWMSWDGNPHDL